jgi:hypothetical protein
MLATVLILLGAILIFIGYHHYIDGTIIPQSYKHGWMTGAQAIIAGALALAVGLRMIWAWISFRKSSSK